MARVLKCLPKLWAKTSIDDVGNKYRVSACWIPASATRDMASRAKAYSIELVYSKLCIIAFILYLDFISIGH